MLRTTCTSRATQSPPTKAVRIHPAIASPTNPCYRFLNVLRFRHCASIHDISTSQCSLLGNSVRALMLPIVGCNFHLLVMYSVVQSRVLTYSSPMFQICIDPNQKCHQVRHNNLPFGNQNHINQRTNHRKPKCNHSAWSVRRFPLSTNQCNVPPELLHASPVVQEEY
jgi:hypothetical protein